MFLRRSVATALRRAETNKRSRLFSTASELDLNITYPSKGEERVALVELARPTRYNSLSMTMGSSLMNLKDHLKPGVRCVVITGEGDKAFSTGRDLKDSKNHSPEEAKAYMHRCMDSVLAINKFEIPTIAAINGFAFGWGVELSLACDLRLAKSDAVMCFPETGLGIFPGAAGTVLLPRLVGPGIAKDLILTSRKFSGEEAFQLGVVNRSVEGSVQDLIEDAIDMACQVASNGPLGVAGARTVIDQGLDLSFDEHVQLSNNHRFPLNDTEDFKTALKAFAEKRTPVFKGQ